MWHDGDGWGVIDSEVTPGGCWAHLSCVLVAGHRELLAGEEVRFSYEAADQDGYSFRAVEAWPVGQEPVRDVTEDFGPSPAMGSTLTLTFDSDTDASSGG